MQQWKISKARLHTGYRLSGRSERNSAGPRLEDVSRDRSLSPDPSSSNASGVDLTREVTPGPIESESVMSTPSPSSSPEHDVQAKDSPEPVSVDIEEAPGSELASNANSSRSLDEDYGDDLALVEECNKHAGALKKWEEDLNAVQAEMDMVKALTRQAAGMVDASTSKKWEEDLDAIQAKMDVMKAWTRRAAGRVNAIVDYWVRFAAEGLSD